MLSDIAVKDVCCHFSFTYKRVCVPSTVYAKQIRACVPDNNVVCACIDGFYSDYPDNAKDCKRCPCGECASKWSHNPYFASWSSSFLNCKNNDVILLSVRKSHQKEMLGMSKVQYNGDGEGFGVIVKRIHFFCYVKLSYIFTIHTYFFTFSVI